MESNKNDNKLYTKEELNNILNEIELEENNNFDIDVSDFDISLVDREGANQIYDKYKNEISKNEAKEKILMQNPEYAEQKKFKAKINKICEQILEERMDNEEELDKMPFKNQLKKYCDESTETMKDTEKQKLNVVTLEELKNNDYKK